MYFVVLSAPLQEPWEWGKKYPQRVTEGETNLPYHRSNKIGNERPWMWKKPLSESNSAWLFLRVILAQEHIFLPF